MTASTTSTTAPSKPKKRGSDFKVLWHLLFKKTKGDTHAERLDSFYSGQADAYDSFRERLLHGRQEMIDAVEFPAGGTWIDMGAGTGENAERVDGERLGALSKVYQVDLSTSLLAVAKARAEQNGWANVEPVEFDATKFVPASGLGSVDVVTFSYSLTMIPDWFAALEHAFALLKPGGQIGVVDFYVGRKYPAEGLKQHSWFTRSFWPVWFASDNVFLDGDHIPVLRSKFEPVVFEERYGKVPYIPFIRAPHYWLVGRKPQG